VSEENAVAHEWATALDLDSYGTTYEGAVIEFGIDLATGEAIYDGKIAEGNVWLVLDKIAEGNVWLVLDKSGEASIVFVDRLSGRRNSCSVTCGEGYFSCCNINPLLGAECKCKKKDDDAKCSSGGAGSTSCSISETTD
jgi:hypothetical protein